MFTTLRTAAARACRRAYTAIPYAVGSGRAFSPLQVALTVTYRCNLKCTMCLQRIEEQKTQKTGVQELSGDEIRDVIRQSVPRIASIGFCGGEIFMRKDIMDLLHFAASRNRVSLVSNGTLITQDIAGELVGMGIGFMLFSVDGPPPMHDRIRGHAGTFAKVMASLEHVLRARTDQKRPGVNVHANCVIMKDNAGMLHELIDHVGATGVRFLGLQLEDRCLHRWSASLRGMAQLFEPPVVAQTNGIANLAETIADAMQYGKDRRVEVYLKPDCTPQEFEDYYNGGMNLDDYECTFPWSQIFISPHGEVYPCFMMTLGNVREQTMNAAWNSEGYRTFRRALRERRLFPQCYGCCFMRKRRSTRHADRPSRPPLAPGIA